MVGGLGSLLELGVFLVVGGLGSLLELGDEPHWEPSRGQNAGKLCQNVRILGTQVLFKFGEIISPLGVNGV